MTVSDLLKGALIQSANDAADALALSRRARLRRRSRTLMNAKAREARAARHALRPPRRARRARTSTRAPRTSRSSRALRHAHPLRARHRARGDRPRSPAAARCTPGTTCSRQFPQTIGVKTGHTDGCGLVPGRGGARARRDDLRDAARQPERARSATTTSSRSSIWGLGAVPRRPGGLRRARLRRGARPVRPRSARARRGEAAADRRSARAAADRDAWSRPRRRRCRCARARCSGASRSGQGHASASGRATSWLRGRLTSPGSAGPSRVVRRQDAAPPGAPLLAHDRHRHTQRGDRPHAHRPELPARAAASRERRRDARRRQGHQRRARAQDARRPGRRHRPRRRRRPARASSSELTDEAILNDFVRIEGESRTSTAVVDPTGGTYTEINEWGPAVHAEELETLLEKLRYLTQGAELVVFAGSLPRDVADDFYAEAAHELARRHILVVLDTRGRAAAARRRGGAVPRLAEPGGGGGARRPGVPRRRGLPARARRRIAEMGAAQRADHDRDAAASRCCARTARRGGSARVAPRVEPVSTVGSGDVLLAGVPRRRATRAGRTRSRCARPSRPVPRRRSRSAPGGSTRGRRAGCRPASRSSELERRPGLSRRSVGATRIRRRRYLSRMDVEKLGLDPLGIEPPGEVRQGRAHLRRRPARARRVVCPAERRLDRDAADAHDRARGAGRLGRDGHGHRGAHGDRARARGRPRDRPAQPLDRGAGRPRSTR